MSHSIFDQECAALLKKKSDKHLRVSIVIFLASAILTSVIGLLYVRQYIQYEKDFIDNLSFKTVYISMNYKNGRAVALEPSDVSSIRDTLMTNIGEKEISVVPVYKCFSVMFNGNNIYLLGIPSEYGALAGIESMENDVVYFTHTIPSQVTLSISVIRQVTDGFESDKIERMTFNASGDLDKRSPIVKYINQRYEGMLDDIQICAVTMDTFSKIASIQIGKDFSDVVSGAENSEIISLNGIYVYCQDIRSVDQIASILTANGYDVETPIDIFEDFNETISIAFFIFILSGFFLLLMTTINIFFSYRSFYRVQRRDFGILKQIGFGAKKIESLYTVNLIKQFLIFSVAIISAITVIGLFLIPFSYWGYVAVAVAVCVVYLLILFSSVKFLILHKYINEDILYQLVDSKEFE